MDSQDPTGNYAATNVFDGDLSTFWHTQWFAAQPPPPHEIQINLGAVYSVNGFRYLPRQDAPYGRIGQYEFYVSSDGTTWGAPVASGTFANNASEQEIGFAPKSGQYIRLRALTEVNGQPWSAAAELNALQGAAPPNQAPNGTINSPAGNVVITAGESVNFTGTGTDPENNTPLTFLWNFGTNSGVANSTSEDPGLKQFNNPGTYTVTFTVTDSQGIADATPATRTVTVQNGNLVPRSNWTLHYVDSQDTVGGNYAATNSFDGDVSTFWHSQWFNAQPPPPHEIQINMGAVYSVNGFRYLPRQDAPYGHIGQYEFYVSVDGTTWGSPVATGTFANNTTEQEVGFTPKAGRYIRLRALNEANGQPWTAVTELNVLQGGAPPNQAPNGTIDFPTGNVVITAGESVNFTGTGTDPENNTPLTFLWNFGANSGLANSTSEDPGLKQFNNPGTYTVTFTVTDSQGMADATPATRTVTVQNGNLIPRSSWTLHYVDSQDTAGGNYAATNSFDGEVSTFWHSQWFNAQPPPPHEIQINMGAVYNVNGFRYLTRQDGSPSGRIGQYEFYVSTDGVNWGAAVASGTFADTASEKEVTFSAKNGRYIRLRALTEASGRPYTAVAELNALQGGAPPNQAPNGTIDSPVNNVSIVAGSSLTFQGAGNDPDNNTPLTFLWNFGAGSGITNSTSEDPGSVQFNNPGTYAVTFTVTDSQGMPDPTPATRTITVSAGNWGSNQAPNGTINAPAGSVTIAAGDSVMLTGTGSDFDGDLPLSFRWNFGPGSGIADITVEDAGTVQFNAPGTFTVTYTVTDSLGLADYTPAQRTVVVQGNTGTVISRTGWTLRFVDSQDTDGGNFAATNAFDGNSNTIWHTQWFNASPLPPHEIQINLGAVHNVSGFRYLPRQDGVSNGYIGQYEFYVSVDGVNWGTPVATGAFPDTASEKEVLFAPKTGLYIRLRALTEANGNPWSSIAELNVLETPNGSNQAPNGAIDLPSSNVTIVAGSTVNFTSTGSDPDNNLPLRYRWSFQPGAGITDITNRNAGFVRFSTPGTYVATLTVADAQGLADATPATRTVTVQGGADGALIPTAGWTVWAVDSQDVVGGNYAATNAFDGNTSTFWHTEWAAAQPPPPHELQIDLGAVHDVAGFHYLPRQDGSANGRIGQYEFYVSTDGVNWGTPVATGTFANTGTEKQVLFDPRASRYIRLRALTEVNGLPYTAVAELGVLTAPVITPSVRLSQPRTYYLQSSADLLIVADASLSGQQGVKFVLDGGPANGGAQYNDYNWPYEVIFSGLSASEHVVDAYVIDSQGAEVSGAVKHDQAVQVGIGDYDVGMGDSITRGQGDSISWDNISQDNRNTDGGYTPVLEDQLTAVNGRPHLIVNEGVGGATSANGLTLIPTLLQRHPQAQRFLVMYGTNDSKPPAVPSGLGLQPGNPGYTGSYKDNMQRIINAIKNAGKVAILAKAPAVLPVNGSQDQQVQQYNQVISELVANSANGIPVQPPDFHTYFQNHTNELADSVHPNGTGYRSIAQLWFQTLTQ